MNRERMADTWRAVALAVLVVLGPLGVVAAPTSGVAAQTLSDAQRVRIARRLARSTVTVLSGPSSGSGFVVGAERWVITNHHVVERGRDAQVRFGSGTTLRARVIRTDPSHDLAILEVVGAAVPSPPLDLANSDEVQVGQTVLAFGSPFGLDGTLTEGIVSARRDVPDVGGGMARRLIQTDAPINPGNSGGPLVDRRGRVVGVNTAILSRTGGSHGIGFAVPANYVAQFLESTRTERRREPVATAGAIEPGGGVSPGSRERSAFLGVLGRDFAGGGFEGVQIQAVQPDSPAARGGLLGVSDAPPELVSRLGVPWTGHIITAIDGRPVHSGAELEAAIRARRPGDSVEVTVTVGPGLLNGTRRIPLGAVPEN